jgi:hypothetical protein
MKEDLPGLPYDSNEEVERTVRTSIKEKMWSSFVTASRNLSIFGRTLWRIVVIMWINK